MVRQIGTFASTCVSEWVGSTEVLLYNCQLFVMWSRFGIKALDSKVANVLVLPADSSLLPSCSNDGLQFNTSASER